VLIWVALALFVGSMIFGRHAEMDHATAAVQMENLSSGTFLASELLSGKRAGHGLFLA
jgi:hypothetical protein